MAKLGAVLTKAHIFQFLGENYTMALPAQEPSQEEREGFSRPQSKSQSNSAEPRTLVCPAATRNQGSGSAQGVEQGLGGGQ